MSINSMQVIKRNGLKEDVSFDKVLNRLKKCSEGLDTNPTLIAQRTLTRIYNGVMTSELDELAAQLCISLITLHFDYSTLATRIIISNHQKNTNPSFSETMKSLRTESKQKILSDEFLGWVDKFSSALDSKIDHSRDYLIDYFGFKTLERQKYLLRDKSGKVVETPQYLWMRVSLALWGENASKLSELGNSDEECLRQVFETYDLISQKYYIHATPTNFNAGSPYQQLSSCYLLAMNDDSIKGIYKTLSDCAQISKHAGGIGLHIHNIRARGSHISGNGGISTGIVPMLRNFNATARYVDQGSKRNGSFAIYIEPWHSDIEEFLRLKLNTGLEEDRARDLFYGLWIPDLFMERVEKDSEWTLFCPSDVPELSETYGSKFKELYEKYESNGVGRKKVSAQKLWFKILDSQIETGTPYMLYKDACNEKSNQKNLGTIKSSNLCVSGETYILTRQGYEQIINLEGKDVEVWNGEKWSSTRIQKTGEMQDLMTVYFSNGSQITCTKYHKFIPYMPRAMYCNIDNIIRDAERIQAFELKPGMRVMPFKIEPIKDNLCCDYCFHHGDAFSLHNEIVPLKACFECRVSWTNELIKQKGKIIDNNTNTIKKSSCCIDIDVKNSFEYADRIRLLFQTLGVFVDVVKNMDERTILCTDERTGDRIQQCKEAWWTVRIYASDFGKLIDLGIIINSKPRRKSDRPIYVTSIIPFEKKGNTYCFNEPLNHAGIFNGILTGNCTEIIEYSSPEETAVCNLASVVLPSFIKGRDFDFNKLGKVVKQITINLNRVIDINFYPLPETKRSNMRHRPIGIGVQGLADVFAQLRIPWESQKARELNQRIFEHLYYTALDTSVDIAIREGVYETYAGCPISMGKLQPDLWGVVPLTQQDGSLDWNKLRQKISKHGIRNSLLISPMPTASTSQIMGSNECFEPITSNIYTRRTLSGEYIIVNKYLMNDLIKRGLWSDEMKQRIIQCNGSVQLIDKIPPSLKSLYKTAWEIKQKTLIDMSMERGAFICQSQSLNLFVSEPTYAKLTSMHFYAWKCGLKTGMYYLRTKAPVMAQKFTIDPELQKEMETKSAKVECSNEEGCLVCGS